MDYYYDKNLKHWRRGDQLRGDHLSDDCERVKQLRNARKNKKYLIVENREGRCKRPHYPGLNADLIYFDIADLKLKLDKRVVLYSEGKFSKSMACISFEDIRNIEVLKNFQDDLDYVVRFVEDLSYLGPENESLKPLIRHNNYHSLCTSSQLYYQMEGNDLDII